MRAACEAPPPPRAGFEASTGVEGDEDEDECHQRDRAGAPHRAEPRERGQGQLIRVRGRRRQLKRILRHFGGRAVFASERQPLSCFFPPPYVLQILRSEDNALLLQARTGEKLRLRGWFGAARIRPAQRFPSRRGEFGTGSALEPPKVPATRSIPLSPRQQASLPSQFRAGRSQSP